MAAGCIIYVWLFCYWHVKNLKTGFSHFFWIFAK